MIRIPNVDLSNDSELVKKWFRITLLHFVDELRVEHGVKPDDTDFVGDLDDIWRALDDAGQKRVDDITHEWCIANYERYEAYPPVYNRYKRMFEEKYKDNPLRIIME